MKYIVWPFFAIFVMACFLLRGIVMYVFTLVWNFRLPSVREAYSIDGEFLFEDYSWKTMLMEILVYNYKKTENSLCDDTEEDD